MTLALRAPSFEARGNTATLHLRRSREHLVSIDPRFVASYLQRDCRMSGILLADNVMDRLRERYPSYHETAYLFILSGLHFTIERLGVPRHISGRELAEGCRDLAIERWGLMARSVLEYWGIRTTRDLGALVFALVECGVLVKQDDDLPGDFDYVYEFEDAFERQYPWPGARQLPG